jgi:ATP-dependent 26S proteasome regulatory subunit
MRERVLQYVKAGFPGLYVQSSEEQRVEAEFESIAQSLKFGLHLWSATNGLLDVGKETVRPLNDPLEALLAIAELPEESIILLRDFHLFLTGDANPVLVGQLKDVLRQAKTQSKTLVIVGCRVVLPPELEREFTVVEFALPGREILQTVLSEIIKSANLAACAGREAALNAARGLTTAEAENAFALSAATLGQICPELIAREKANAIRKSGLLEVIEPAETMDSVGGLDLLKEWILKRRNSFSERAREFGLPLPKGVLIIGVPGTGKSLTAKVTAKALGVPLLKLDVGRIYGGLVGQSESNLRAAIQTAEAIAPCVLWIDEIEKGLSGSKSSGSTDGGTSARVFGTLLSWMQEKTVPVFMVATANDVSQLPPEFLRKGRWDELFVVDLPNAEERRAIWDIQIAKYRRDPKDFDLVQLAKATEGLTGSEIEAVFTEALHDAFDADGEPTDLSIASVLTTFVPLSEMMKEQLSSLRAWAKGRARPATSQLPERKLRRIAA